MDSIEKVYSIVKELRRIKWTHSACLLLLSIAIESRFWKRITINDCKELLWCSPTQAVKILKQYNVIDFKEWRLLEPNFDSLTSWVVEEENEYSKFSWKYWKQFHNSFKSFWHLLIKIAEGKRYTPEEYFERLLKEVRKDNWWKNIITEEMAIRKIEFLDKKFWINIPMKVGWLSEVTHIF